MRNQFQKTAALRRLTMMFVAAIASAAAWAWDGAGSAANPYQIRNSADWNTLADKVSAGQVDAGTVFKLMGDINISKPVGTSDHRFSGTFDGGGNTITVNLSATSGLMAPFAYATDVTISHLNVTGTIRGGLHTAGLCGGVMGTSRITDCHVSAAITTFAENGKIVSGGLVGHGNSATLTVEGCLFDGSITATSSIDYSYAGTIVGWCNASEGITVKNCIENGTYTNINHAGMNYKYNANANPSASAITSANSYSLNHNWGEVKHGYKITYLSDTFKPKYYPVDTYSTTGIEASAIGLKLGDFFYAGSGETVTIESYYVDDGFIGYDFSTQSEDSNNPTSSSIDYFLTMPSKDVYVSQYKDFEGDGDADRPYLIKNEDDWQHFALNLNDQNLRDMHYLLTSDIDIHVPAGGEYVHSGDLIKCHFLGTFDGGGHTITAHLSGGEFTAPFYKIDGATIKNLHVAGEISGGIYSAGLVGSIQTNADKTNLIENCRVSATITCITTHAGGFVGHASGSTTTLRGCLFDGTLSGGVLANAGCLVGWCSNSAGGITLEDCAAYNQHVYAASGFKTDLVLDDTRTARCSSATNTYGGYDVGSSRMELCSGNPALKLTYALSAGLTAPVEYPVSHLASYGVGLLFDNDKFFVGRTEQPRFQISVDDGLSFSNVSANDATLTGPNEGWYTLQLGNTPNVLITINATVASNLDFKGEGTEASPYIIGSSPEWAKLSIDVAGGNSYAGKVFRLAQDIDCEGISVGTDEHPFSGTFDGDGHTLTLRAGREYNPVATAASPFYRVSKATFRHLHTAGKVCTSAKFTGGIISQIIGGSSVTRLSDCHSSMTIYSTINDDASNGGLVGMAYSCDSLVIDRCTFTGNIHSRGSATNCGGFIGYSYVPVTIRESLFDPADLIWYNLVRIGQNFVRMSDYTRLTMKDCYTTFNFEAETLTLALAGPQGTFVVDELYAPDGCSYEFVGEPDVTFNGRSYYKNGCWIRTTLDASIPFNHWQDGLSGGCFISDPWTRNGLHQLKDLKQKPSLGVWTSPIPEAETERTIFGVTYRYLSRRDYHFYISDEDRVAKGWTFENDDSDANMVVYDSSNDPSEITAVVGFSDKSSDLVTRDGVKGVLIRNDLFITALYNHTHLGLIAPHAFRGSTQLEKLFFEDNDDSFGNARTPFDFFIDQGAFEGCPNFKELMLMQYTTEGNNHWTGLTPKTTTTSAQIFRVADDAFNECPKLRISVRADHYQGYLSSAIWKMHQNRFIPYEATDADFTVKGVKYRWYRDVATEDNDGIKNDEAGKADMMTRLILLNGMYKQFSAASLLDTKDDCNVYYASVVGVDNDDIDGQGGTMRIYNDPGSYWNYKTITLNVNAIAGNTHVKNIEFWQTNGRSENSYSDLKMVIPNGAFKGCTALEQLRLFYYEQDGKDRWMALGPKDVIPGDNIFGFATADELLEMTEEQRVAQWNQRPQNFKILVSTELYPEFKDDPNWQPYLAYIEPVDYSPSPKGAFTNSGLTYDYMTSPGGIMQASQVVSQDVSWWTAPRIAIEVALAAYTLGSFISNQGAMEATTTASREAFSTLCECSDAVTAQQAVIEAAEKEATAIANVYAKESIVSTLSSFIATKGAGGTLKGLVSNSVFNQLVSMGVCDETGKLIATEAVLNGLTVGQLSIVQTSVLYFARNQVTLATTELAAKESLYKAAEQAWKTIALRRLLAAKLDMAHAGVKALTRAVSPASIATASASLISSSCWGGSGTYNADAMNKGMRENILSNIHQVGLVGGGYVITTPQKNLVYHTYIKSVAADLEDAVIYAGFDNDNNSNTSNRTMTFLPAAFQNKTSLKTVKFHDISNQSSNTGMSFLFTIPDEAFKGCTALTEFSTLLQTDGNGTRALGPENFILAGDKIFDGRKSKAEVDSLTEIGQGAGLVPFYIVIDPLREDDFLASESWKPLKKFFKYESALPTAKYSEYGASYAYAYEQNSIKKEHKVGGHLIEHTLVTGPDDDSKFIKEHQGAVKLCNDIGVYNNYQLDEVKAEAFKGNPYLRSVSFVDLYGAGAFGDCYTGLQVHLGDRAFENCTNLANLDLLYMVTDGINHIEPMTPQMISIGKDVFKGTNAKLKMLPQQVAWFEADDAWAAYKDRFMPCVIRFTDPGIKAALKEMAYYDPANTGTDPAKWEDYCDFARIGGAGFSWLDGRFTAQKDNIYSFAEFKYFESVGLNYVGASWFEGCSKLGNIVLPGTITTIGTRAFNGCTALQEIELPAGVTAINDNAFGGCTSLNTIIVKGDVPATLGAGVFDKHNNLKIYVPDDKVAEYKAAWSEYEQYIDRIEYYTINNKKEVRVTAVGQLASKLGLTLIKENSKVRYIQGPYAKYESLTVIGPLNGEDVAVLRHMMGADAYDSDFTDGQLRYLNLWDADLKEDDDNSYNGYGVDEYLEKDNWVGEYMFHNCNALESVVLPKTVTEIGENAFQEAYGLKRIAVGQNTTTYTRDLLQDLTGIEELVFLTNTHATSGSSDPWEAPIMQVYTLPSQLGDYLGDPNLTKQAQDITSPFSTDDLMWLMASKGHFFPSEYLQLESVEDIFKYNHTLTNLDEFYRFQNVKRLEDTFTGMDNLETITLPSSIESISATAFSGCLKLKTIHVNSVEVIAADKNAQPGTPEAQTRYILPTLAQDAFSTLPSDFQILVPKEYCKVYREQWSQYADHINPDNTYYSGEEIMTVTVTEPNTLAAALGLTATIESASGFGGSHVNSLKGDYSKIYKLKVIGPISGGDLDVLRYLAGWCPWATSRNYAGRLEYIDLYDAELKATTVGVAGYRQNASSLMLAEDFNLWKINTDNVLPHHAFLRAYNLKTLILPRTCTEVEERALQECEGLETLVLGDKMTTFNWNALDDDAMLTRMYILAENKVEISTQFAVWRWLCNNYSPTFDAFYVRPSLYQEYLDDPKYTFDDQRTNNISKGDFEDDESFCVFAAHAAATFDDLTQVYSVDGWFDNHTGVRDLTALGFAAIDKLHAADMQKLTQLEKVTLPMTLTTIEDGAFSQSPGLRYVDMLMCNNDLVTSVKTRGFDALGINTQQTLVYLPQTYGEAAGTNIVVSDGTSLSAETFRLVDGKDYCVPHAFTAGTVENSRSFATAGNLYTVCLPYKLNVPVGATVYQLSERSGDELVFQQVTGELEAMKPYLIKPSTTAVTLHTTISQEIPADGGGTFGRQTDVPGLTMRGTFQAVSNAEAHELGAYLMQSDNRWYPAPAGIPAAYIPAFRCYLLQNGGTSASSLTSRFVDDMTGVETIRTVDADGSESVYDLSGRRITTGAKGIVIGNGKKYINK